RSPMQKKLLERPGRRFLFRLALELGMTVSELSHRLTMAELAEWQAYAALDPFGNERGDYHAALASSTIVNVNRGRHPPAFNIEDFMPDCGGGAEPPREQTVTEQKLIFRAIALAHGADFTRPRAKAGGR